MSVSLPASRVVAAGRPVSLTATSSATTVAWSQVSGPAVALIQTGLTARFDAPLTAGHVVIRATEGVNVADIDLAVTRVQQRASGAKLRTRIGRELGRMFVLTSDTFTTPAADRVAFGARLTEPGNLGGYPMLPSSTNGTLAVSGGRWLGRGTPGEGAALYATGTTRPYVAFDIVSTGADGIADARLASDSSGGYFRVRFRASAKNAITSWNAPGASDHLTAQFVPAGTWADGDRVECWYEDTTSTVHARITRAGVEVGEWTQERVNPVPTAPFSGIGTSSVATIVTLDNMVIGAAPYYAMDLASEGPTDVPIAAEVTHDDLFNADYPSLGFSQYYRMYPTGVAEGIDYGVVQDPAGSASLVAFFDNFRGFREGVTEPRAAGAGPGVIRPSAFGNSDDEYWFGASLYLPAWSVPKPPQNWFTACTPAFGPPYVGSSPLVISFTPHTETSVKVGIGGGLPLLGAEYYIPTDTWWRVIINFKFAYDGWARMWTGFGLGGTDWTREKLNGAYVLPMATMKAGVNDDCATDPLAPANSSRVSAYGSAGRFYFGHHALARRPTPAVLGQASPPAPEMADIAYVGAGAPATANSVEARTTASVPLGSTVAGHYNMAVIDVMPTANATDPGSLTVPAGWSVIGSTFDTGSPGVRLSVLGKAYAPGDPAALSVSWTATSSFAAVCVAYSGVDGAGTMPATLTAQAEGSATFSTGTVTSTEPGWLVTVAGCRTTGTWTMPDTARASAAVASSVSCAISDTGANVAPGAYSRTATIAWTSVGVAGIVALRPGPVIAPPVDPPGGTAPARFLTSVLHSTFDDGLDAAWRMEPDGSNYGSTNNSVGVWSHANISTGPAMVGPGNSLKLRSSYDGTTYRCGMVQTRAGTGSGGDVLFPRYARFEARMRVPQGKAIWPGMWLRHANGSSVCEVDIAEFMNGATAGHSRFTLHRTGVAGGGLVTGLGSKNLLWEQPYEADGVTRKIPTWRTIACEIYPEDGNPSAASARVVFDVYIDGVLKHSYTDPSAGYWSGAAADPDRTFDICLQGAQLGGTWIGHPDDAIGYSRYLNGGAGGCLVSGTPPSSCATSYGGVPIVPTVWTADLATYEVDYVKVWKFTG